MSAGNLLLLLLSDARADVLVENNFYNWAFFLVNVIFIMECHKCFTE